MNKLNFRLAYLLRKTRWDSGITPPEVVSAFLEDERPPANAIDLGCGTGTNAVFMAKHGWQVIGIDFIPKAISRARKKARQAGVSSRTRFIVGDVTRLEKLSLPSCQFALDIGCFHGQNTEGQRRYVSSLAKILTPGGRYMLYVIDPRLLKETALNDSEEYIRAMFSHWFIITHLERGNFGSRSSTWFWMDRKPGNLK